MRHFPKAFWKVLPASLALMFAQGCSQVHVRGQAAATAPLLGEEGQAHIRGVSDPNAPFTLIDRTYTVAQPASSANGLTIAPCELSSLQVYEAAASINGEERSLRLAIKNNSLVACHLAGSPSIALEDAGGAPIASIAVRQTGTSSLTGSVAPPIGETGHASDGMAPSVDVVLQPSGEASFQIGWLNGDDCPAVASIGIGILPRRNVEAGADSLETPKFAIHHSIRVCNGEVRVSELSFGNSV